MPGIIDPNTIDLVAQDSDGTYLLVMVEDRPWGTDAGQPSQVREKINSYAGFVMDGSLTKAYPEITGRRLLIQLNCVGEPTSEIQAIIDHAASALMRLGIDFRVRLMP